MIEQFECICRRSQDLDQREATAKSQDQYLVDRKQILSSAHKDPKEIAENCCIRVQAEVIRSYAHDCSAVENKSNGEASKKVSSAGRGKSD